MFPLAWGREVREGPAKAASRPTLRTAEAFHSQGGETEGPTRGVSREKLGGKDAGILKGCGGPRVLLIS